MLDALAVQQQQHGIAQGVEITALIIQTQAQPGLLVIGDIFPLPG
ncbi:hypothetical protein SDC9_173907 [bioreactor metagenome]|uniref:Uncharacterized protein n=1 Tax=bioreactor metagenome TaxID=1076179 RepID=A0A645GKT4_9ZZZZ